MKLLSFLLFFCSGLYSAQYDIDLYLASALKNSHSVKELSENAELAKNDYISSFAGMYLPHLYYSLADTPYSDSHTDFSVKKKEMSSEFSASYNLFNNFTDKLNLEAASIGRIQAERNLWLKKQETALKAVKTYCEVLKNKKLLSVVKASEDSYADEYRKAAQYYAEGLKSYSDLLKSELNLKTAQLSSVSSENSYKNSMMEFNYEIYLDPEEENVLDEIKFDTSPEIPDIAAEVTKALKNRREIRNYQDGIKIKELELRQKLIAYFPLFSADAGYSRSEVLGIGDSLGRNDSYFLKFSMTIPFGSDLFDKSKNYASSSIYLERQKRALEDLKLYIKKEVISNLMVFSYARKRYEVSKAQAEITKNNLEIIKEKYSGGRASIIDLIEAQKDDLSAQSDLAASFYDLYSAAAEHKAVVGEQLWKEE